MPNKQAAVSKTPATAPAKPTAAEPVAMDAVGLAPKLFDTLCLLVATLAAVLLMPTIAHQLSPTLHKDLFQGAVEERAALAAFDAETDAQHAKFDALAEAGGDSAAEIARSEYDTQRDEARKPLSEATNAAIHAREDLVSNTRLIALVITFVGIAMTVPRQFGLGGPTWLGTAGGLIASVASAVWMLVFVPDPNAANPFSRVMAVLLCVGVVGWGLWAFAQKRKTTKPTTAG